MGLTQALGAHLGYNAIANVRQPSMGPTFGVKEVLLEVVMLKSFLWTSLICI